MVPRYLIECLPYFTVLNLGIKKSEFRRVNWLSSVCMVPSIAKLSCMKSQAIFTATFVLKE